MAINETSTQFVRTFEQNAIHLVQQKASKLRRTVTEKNPGPTEKHSFRVVAPRGAMTDRANVGTNAGKRTATAFEDTVFNDRVASTTYKTTADSFSRPDVNRMLQDPGSVLYQAMVPQVGRTYDDVIIAAFHAAALDTLGNSTAFGATFSGLTPTYPTLGSAAQMMNFDMVAAMLEAFNTDNVDPDEEKFFVISPNSVTKILNEPKATSVDWVNARAVMSGNVVNGWMGFSWIMSTRLTGPNSGEKYNIAYTRDAIGLLVLQDVTFDSGPSPTQQFDTIMQLAVDIGAVRIQEMKAKRLWILDS